MTVPSSSIVPAQLGFLAIYNPSLGATDETVDDQLVYYASIDSSTGQQRRRHRSISGKPIDRVSQEERNERLRQIGLAQGMIEFSKSFSGDLPVDTIETEKSRVVLHELEPGWWILASVDLTRLPLPAGKNTSSISTTIKGKSLDQAEQPTENIEYSSREVKPSALLLQDLLRAHSIFLLHHDSSLSALFVRSQRAKFSGLLGRYWDLFLSTWNILLHGNPIRNVFGGIKIAACGELGVGVGEEDRGSGEREVLEGLVGRIEGLVDLVVGKFGDAGGEEADSAKNQNGKSADTQPWLGTGNEAGAEDGAIFLGVGALSRHSLRDITYWMEDMYSWGENAYGVSESPTATRVRRKRPRPVSPRVVAAHPVPNDPQVPPPLRGLPGSSNRYIAPSSELAGTSTTTGKTTQGEESEIGGMDKFMNILKLGYGTSWTLGSISPVENPDLAGLDTKEPRSSGRPSEDKSVGHYLIGLLGDIEEKDNNNDPDEPYANYIDDPEANSRRSLRTLIVELELNGRSVPESEVTKDLGSHDRELQEQNKDGHGRVTGTAGAAFDSQDRNKTKKLRVVVYVNKPFIFIFLFQLRTDSLAWDPLYRSIHHQLAPLRKPLVSSTAYRPARPEAGSVAAQIYDLVWDPRAMTVHSTLPNIPEPSLPGVPDLYTNQPPWSRVEALNTHTQLLTTYAATRADPTELERTCKTSRGWWVVWSRILEREAPPSPKATSQDTADLDSNQSSEGEDEVTPTQDYVVAKEIVLIRKAGDQTGSGLRGVSGSYVTGGGGGAGWADGASRLAQGIGVDTRKYIEGLLSLNR